MRFGQLFGCMNHYAQERHDELISIILTIFYKNRWQARCKSHATFSPPLTHTHFPPCPSTRHRICLSRTRKQHAHTRAPAEHTLRTLCECVSCCLRATVCNIRSVYTATWRDTASWRENLRPE